MVLDMGNFMRRGQKYRRAEFMNQNADDSANKTYKTLRIWHNFVVLGKSVVRNLKALSITSYLLFMV